MSGKFSIGFQSAAALAGAAYAVLQNIDSAPGQRLRLYEIGFTTNASTLASVGLAYVPAGSLGTPSGAPILLTADDDADLTAVKASVATSWSVPAAPVATYKRMFVAATTQGAGYVWSFPDGLIVSPTAGYALWNFSGSSSGPSLSCWVTLGQ